MSKNLIVKIIVIFLIIISLLSAGSVGLVLNDVSKYLLGFNYFLYLIFIIGVLIYSIIYDLEYRLKFLIGIFLMIVSIDLLLSAIKFIPDLGTDKFFSQFLLDKQNINDKIGLIQGFIIYLLNLAFGFIGVIITTVILFIIGFLTSFHISIFSDLFNKIKMLFISDEEDEDYNYYDESLEDNKDVEEQDMKEQEENSDLFELTKPITGNKGSSNVQRKITENKNTALNDEILPIDDIESYKVPPINLLSDVTTNASKYKNLQNSAKSKVDNLIDSLESFKVNAKVENIIVGSTITKYELSIEKGQKVSKFKNLSDDLSLALASSSIRIEAPIPGKSLVGIEIPNDEKIMVGLKEVIKSKNNNFSNKLEVALGKDIYGKDKFIDITKTPHLLVAGATGSGKSVCINSIIISILLKANPQEVKFLLIDPKKVELTPYDGIPHLLAPVITNVEKATIALNKLVDEMERRYELFTQTGSRNIASYNENMPKSNKLPLIVAVIDELADLMMVASSDVEISISRIAQKARAAGIHLILATQRPSTDVITGLIKANIPSRISFMVSSAIDSRTILSTSGAEKLLGNGDMLVALGNSSVIDRVQGGYLSDKEIYKVIDYIKKQFVNLDLDKYYKEDFLKLEKENEITNIKEDMNDPLIDEAISIGIVEGRISASLLQRRLKVGYNRATRMIEDLEAQGKVSKPEGNKGRKVLVTQEEEENEPNI